MNENQFTKDLGKSKRMAPDTLYTVTRDRYTHEILEAKIINTRTREEHISFEHPRMKRWKENYKINKDTKI